VNAKSIMGVLTLAAAIGTELVLQADGPDERQAVDALTTLFQDRFGEHE
jgi:phosphocarrier protein